MRSWHTAKERQRKEKEGDVILRINREILADNSISVTSSRMKGIDDRD